MRYGESRSQRRAVTVIECEKLLGRSVAQDMRHPPPEIVPRPRRAKALTLQCKKRDFIERIIDPKARVEFEAVDDSDLVIQPDMLRSQVAVAVYDPAVAQSRNLMTVEVEAG